MFIKTILAFKQFRLLQYDLRRRVAPTTKLQTSGFFCFFFATTVKKLFEVCPGLLQISTADISKANLLCWRGAGCATTTMPCQRRQGSELSSKTPKPASVLHQPESNIAARHKVGKSFKAQPSPWGPRPWSPKRGSEQLKKKKERDARCRANWSDVQALSPLSLMSSQFQNVLHEKDSPP